MTSRFHINADLIKMIRYNEAKIAVGNARNIGTHIWNSVEVAHQTRIVHHILSFHPADKLSDEQMLVILKRFMKGIGVEYFPYIAFRHLDTASPHIHQLIVVPGIYGEDINLKSIRIRSKEVIDELVKELDLNRAAPVNERAYIHKRPDLGPPVNRVSDLSPLQQILAGPTPKRHTVEIATNRVLDHFRFCNLNEYNALLREYGVRATLSQGGRVYYQVLNEQGKPEGMPVYPSGLRGKPNLYLLNHKMQLYIKQRPKALGCSQAIVLMSLDHGFYKDSANLKGFLENCLARGIALYWQHVKGQEMPELVYINYYTKWAHHQEAMGENFSASAILNKCHQPLQELEQVLSKFKAPYVEMGKIYVPSQWDQGFSR